MARLDVDVTPAKSGVGFVVDVQASMLEFMEGRVVVPLLLAGGRLLSPARDLHPSFEINGQEYLLVPQAAAAVPKRNLRTKVASLDKFHDQIVRAQDILLLGL